MFTSAPSKPQNKKSARLYQILSVFAIACIMIPACFVVGFLSYIMTLALLEAGQDYQGLLVIIHFMSLFALVFGFQVVLTSFYFSSDLEHLLPLPLKTSEIILIKLLRTYMAECGLELFTIFSAFVGYFIAAGITIKSFLFMLIGLFTIPIFPMVECALFSIIGMALPFFMRTKRQTNLFVWAMSLGLTGFAFYSMGGLDGIMVENFVESMQNNTSGFLISMNRLFYTNYLFTRAFAGGNVVEFLAYLLINILGILVLLFVANKLYLYGLNRLNSTSNAKRKGGLLSAKQSYEKKSAGLSYYEKEFRLLFRTGSYISNCVLMTYVWPFALALVFFWKGQSQTFMKYREFMSLQLGKADLYYLMLHIILACLIPGANAIAATAFSREGQQITFMKSIPLSYGTQIKRKAKIAIDMAVFAGYLCVMIASLFINPGMESVLCLFVLYLGMTIAITYLGIYLDSVHPRLTWEDEGAVMRGNVNVFFHMSLSMLIAGVLCAMAFLLYAPDRKHMLILYVFFALLSVLLAVASRYFFLKKSIRRLHHLTDESED